MENKSENSERTCDPEVQEWSEKLAKRVRKARHAVKIDPDYLAELTQIDEQRLESLLGGKEVFRAHEVQLLGIVLGVGVDEVFCLPKSWEQNIHDRFVQLIRQEIGLLAATPGGKSHELKGDQEAFERSIVHLHYCAECLAKFPS